MFTLDDIKKLCQQYDKSEGAYPENHWEGFSLYKFICHKLDSTLLFNENDMYIWEEDMENV